MAFDMKTHNVKVRAGKQVLIRVNPHIRLKHGDDPPVFIQDGHFYAENGDEYDPVPGWVEEEVEKLTEAAKREAGLLKPDPKDVAKARGALAEENKGRSWGQPTGDPGIIVTEGATRAAMGEENDGRMPPDMTEKMAGTHGRPSKATAAKTTRPLTAPSKREVAQAGRHDPTEGEMPLSEAEVDAQLRDILADEPDDPAPTTKRK